MRARRQKIKMWCCLFQLLEPRKPGTGCGEAGKTVNLWESPPSPFHSSQLFNVKKKNKTRERIKKRFCFRLLCVDQSVTRQVCCVSSSTSGNCNIGNANPPSLGTSVFFRGSILVQFQCRVRVSDPAHRCVQRHRGALKYRNLLSPSCTYRSVSAAAGDDAPLEVYYCHGLTQSISPSSGSDMADGSSARSTASPPLCCSAYHTAAPPGDQQVRRDPIRIEYLCFPVSCVRRRCIPL